jgi:amidase
MITLFQCIFSLRSRLAASASTLPLGVAVYLLAMVLATEHTFGETVRFDLSSATIADVQAAKEAGALTSERLIGLYLARISAYDKAGPKINSIITLNPEALTIARALDVERKISGPRSPMHGIPVVLKDLFDTKDMPTSAGFLPMKNSLPLHDATIVRRLKEDGAIILAKVNMSDWFGVAPQGDQSTVLGRTSNPYNLDLTPGVSSGGTGAAVAAVFGHVGLGSETGVSIRNPTANNSLVGLAPTRGLIPRAGMTVTSFFQERAGPMGRSVYDVAALTDSVAGFDAEDLITTYSLGKRTEAPLTSFLVEDGLVGARIGVLRDLFRSGPQHQEGVAMIEKAISQMKGAGATIIDNVTTNIDMITLMPEMRSNRFEGIFSYEVYFRRLGPDAPIRNLDELVEKGGDLLKPSILEAITTIDALDFHKSYLARLQTQEMLKDALLHVMDAYQLDALVYPFRTRPPNPHMERFLDADNPVSSVTGLPAVLVPAGYTAAENGPISLEILGRPFSEPTLFRIAYGYEQVSKNRKHPPTVPPLIGEVFTYVIED